MSKDTAEARMVWFGWKGRVPISDYTTQVASYEGRQYPTRRSALKAALAYRQRGLAVKIEHVR